MRKSFLRRRSPSGRQRGVQIVEVALMMPVMMFLLGIIAEYGRYFHMRSALLRATATGARYMTDKANSTTEKDSAKSMAVCGKTVMCDTTNTVFSGFAEANVTVTITGDTVAGKYVVVETNGISYKPIINLTKLSKYFSPDSLNWGDKPIVVKTRMQYTGS